MYSSSGALFPIDEGRLWARSSDSALVFQASDQTLLCHLAEAAFPEECCGILLGHQISTQILVTTVISTENVAAEPQHRFEISVKDLFATQKKARVEGLEIVGYFHSHPTSRAEPSEVDRRHGFPGVRQVILGLESGAVVELRSWILSQDRLFAEEATELVLDMSSRSRK